MYFDRPGICIQKSAFRNPLQKELFYAPITLISLKHCIYPPLAKWRTKIKKIAVKVNLKIINPQLNSIHSIIYGNPWKWIHWCLPRSIDIQRLKRMCHGKFTGGFGRNLFARYKSKRLL